MQKIIANLPPLFNLWGLGLGFLTLIFITFLSGIFRAIQSKRWPVTPGEIIESTIKKQSEIDGRPEVYKRYTYRPVVRYRYSVAGESLEGNQVRSGVVSSSSEADAQRIIAQYSLRKKVSVFHHPGRPQLAVLEPGHYLGSLVATVISGAALGLLVFLWLDHFKS